MSEEVFQKEVMAQMPFHIWITGVHESAVFVSVQRCSSNSLFVSVHQEADCPQYPFVSKIMERAENWHRSNCWVMSDSTICCGEEKDEHASALETLNLFLVQAHSLYVFDLSIHDTFNNVFLGGMGNIYWQKNLDFDILQF